MSNSPPVLLPVFSTDSNKNVVSFMAPLLLPRHPSGPRWTRGVRPQPARVSDDVAERSDRGKAGCVRGLTNERPRPIIYFL